MMHPRHQTTTPNKSVDQTTTAKDRIHLSIQDHTIYLALLVQLTEIKCAVKSLIELACSDDDDIAIHTTTDGTSSKNNTNNELWEKLDEISCQLKSI